MNSFIGIGVAARPARGYGVAIALRNVDSAACENRAAVFRHDFQIRASVENLVAVDCEFAVSFGVNRCIKIA